MHSLTNGVCIELTTYSHYSLDLGVATNGRGGPRSAQLI
jgi:hypothetical protein